MYKKSTASHPATAAYIGTMTLALWLALGPLCMGQPVSAAPDEHVDRMTQKALKADTHIERGSELFDRYCARCHGEHGLGDANQGVPALAGQRFAYLIRQLANFTGDERDSSTMHGVVRDQEIRNPQSWADIAGYLNHSTVASPSQPGPADDLKLGRTIFQEQCAACHGADAGGDVDGFVPSLRHQHYMYLLLQMHKLASGYRHNVDEGLLLFLRGFDDREMSATASYLSRLQGARQDRKQLREDGIAVD
jgi:cytochrome c553